MFLSMVLGCSELNIINMLRRGVIVIGAGGAGDIVSAYVMCEVLKSLVNVRKCVPVAILWERWVLDPYPGPIPRCLIRNAVRNSACVYVGSNTYVVRGFDYKFRPQASIIAELSGATIPGITLERGVQGIVECVEELLSEGFDSVIALDVGGDILAYGYEESLWSPLADSLTLAALHYFSNRALVAILAPGADGELDHDYVIKRIADVGSEGGLVGALGIWRDFMNIYEKLLERLPTEASRAPYLALKGVMGELSIRSGSRRIKITPNTIVTYFLDPQKVLKQQPLPQRLIDTKSLAEAMKASEELGIPTELHLEIEIAKTYGCGPHTIGKIDWRKIKERIKTKLKNTKKQETRTGGQSSGVG